LQEAEKKDVANAKELSDSNLKNDVIWRGRKVRDAALKDKARMVHEENQQMARERKRKNQKRKESVAK